MGKLKELEDEFGKRGAEMIVSAILSSELTPEQICNAIQVCVGYRRAVVSGRVGRPNKCDEYATAYFDEPTIFRKQLVLSAARHNLSKPVFRRFMDVINGEI